MATIYRKYRAQNFQEIIGQDQIVKILRKAVAEDRFSHAYLFTGPRGTGKTSMARILSKAVNCLELRDGDPCNQCANCTSINQGKFMDLIEIDAASNRGIDEIRGLKEGIGFLPSEGKRKVYIIDEVHMLTEPAFNALLKTLEEPPSQVMFILATTEPHKLPLTIISRTQRFDFKLADDSSLIIKLSKILAAEEVKLNKEALNLIVKAGQGSFRDAETILEKVLSSVERGSAQEVEFSKEEIEKILGYVDSATIKNFIDNLVSGDLSASLSILDQIYQNGANLLQFSKECLVDVRLRMLADISSHGGNINKLLLIIKEFNIASQDIKTSLINILPLELAVLNICNLRKDIEKNTPNKTSIAQIVEAPKNIKQSIAKQVKESVEVTQTPIEVKNVNINSLGTDSARLMPLIEKYWPEILQEAKKYNHFLTAILSGAKFSINSENVLILGVKSGFHKKQIENAETRRMLNKIITSVCGEDIDFECIIDKGLLSVPDSKKSNADLVESILF